MPQEFCWLVEIPGPMWLHPARGDGVCGFTNSPHDAQRFPTKEAAQTEINALNGALGGVPTEHGFVDRC